jgi:pyruvate dehydrogenase E2 component (dihydrolipoamide acetyltransferase)
MSIELKTPALSPTMEEGTLAKWLVKEGDLVKAGDLLAEIETDKATMEFEAVDEGRIAKILIGEGSDGVAVGTVIALIGDGDAAIEAPAATETPAVQLVAAEAAGAAVAGPGPEAVPAVPVPAPQPKHDPILAAPRARLSDRIKVSPLAARIAEAKGIDLEGMTGSGPGGRIVRADLGLPRLPSAEPQPVASVPAPAARNYDVPDVPHEIAKLSNMRKVIARRLTESKQQVPHIYLTVDVQLDALLKLRTELNGALEDRGVKLSVNDMVIKALALALIEVPVCNVQFAGDQLVQFKRADISVAVSIPNGLITPVIVGAESKSLSAIAVEMKDLASHAREGKLQPHEYQGGTASLSNLGMFGIKQFEAVINPPQAMIMAVGAGEKRPYVVNASLGIATVISATGSFDHRAIDGADAAALMQAFKRSMEQPLLIIG